MQYTEIDIIESIKIIICIQKCKCVSCIIKMTENLVLAQHSQNAYK